MVVRGINLRMLFLIPLTIIPLTLDATKGIEPRISRISRIKNSPSAPPSENNFHSKRRQRRSVLPSFPSFPSVPEKSVESEVKSSREGVMLTDWRAVQRTQGKEVMLFLLCDLCVLCGCFKCRSAGGTPTGAVETAALPEKPLMIGVPIPRLVFSL